MGREPAIGAILAAVLLPPLGVFLVEGLARDFWVGVALTLLGWIPGMIFALMVVMRQRDTAVP